jgi:hypothetical protein
MSMSSKLKSHMLISSPNEQYYYCRKLSPDSSKPYKPIDLFFQDFRSAPRNLSTPLRGDVRAEHTLHLNL